MNRKEIKINWQPAHLEDDIVKLSPLSTLDFDDLSEAASDPLIWEQHPTKERYKRAVFQVYFDGAISAGTAFLITDKTSNRVIGCTRYYDYNQEESSIAIGYTFLERKFWGGLYNRSSKKLLLDYAFLFVDKVFFHIGANNIRSQVATLKMGALKTGDVDLDHNGEKLLHYEYVIHKQEWIKYPAQST